MGLAIAGILGGGVAWPLLSALWSRAEPYLGDVVTKAKPYVEDAVEKVKTRSLAP